MNQINLVPLGYKKRHRRKWHIIFGIIGSAVACITLVTLAFIPVFKMSVAKQEQERLIEALESKEMIETKTVLNEIIETQNRNDQAAILLEKLDEPSHITRQTMDIIVGSVPKGLRMNEIIMGKKDHNIIIDGHAHSVTKVAQYIVQLYNTGQFDIVEYSANPNNDTKIPGWIDYNIRIKPRNFMTEEGEDIG